LASFSSGTGFAGILGAAIYLVLQAYKIPNKYSFIVMGPLVALTYFFTFRSLNKRKNKFINRKTMDLKGKIFIKLKIY
jgi:phosphotransferase system  glucose/maltose/N-acetylglucosamine-specific IIC component